MGVEYAAFALLFTANNSLNTGWAIPDFSLARDHLLGEYSPMSLVILRLGQWSIVAVCRNCKTLIPVFDDLTELKSELKTGSYLTCPQCKHSCRYDTQHYQLQERRKPEIGSDETSYL